MLPNQIYFLCRPLKTPSQNKLLLSWKSGGEQSERQTERRVLHRGCQPPHLRWAQKGYKQNVKSGQQKEEYKRRGTALHPHRVACCLCLFVVFFCWHANIHHHPCSAVHITRERKGVPSTTKRTKSNKQKAVGRRPFFSLLPSYRRWLAQFGRDPRCFPWCRVAVGVSSQPKRLKKQIDKQQTMQQLISKTLSGDELDGRTHIVDDNKGGEQSVCISPNDATLLHPERSFLCGEEHDRSNVVCSLYYLASCLFRVTAASSLVGREFGREQLFVTLCYSSPFFSLSITLVSYIQDCTLNKKHRRGSSQKKSGSVYTGTIKSEERPTTEPCRYLPCFSSKKQKQTTLAHKKDIIPMSLPRIELGLLDSKSRGLSIILQALLTEID